MTGDASDADRRACVKPLVAYEREFEGTDWWNRPSARRILHAIYLAKIGCATEARMAERTLRQWWGQDLDDATAGLILRRRPLWLDAVYDRVADDPGEWGQLYPMFERLRLGLGRSRPRTDGYLRAYLQKEHRAVEAGDPEFLTLLPDILRVDEVGTWLFGEFPQRVAAFVNAGAVDRDEIIGIAFEVLMRGGRPGHLRPFVHILKGVTLSADELARHCQDFVRLVPGSPNFVATFAVNALRVLEKSAPLPDDVLIEVGHAVFARSEKALATKQLSWIATRAKGSERTDDWVDVAAAALAHERPDVQEAALKLLGKLWAGASASARERVAFGIDAVAPRLREHARQLVGEAAAPPTDGGARHELEAATPAPVETVDPIADLDELVQAISRVAETGDGLEAERVFDGLLRFASTDRAILADAFAPLLPRLQVPSLEEMDAWGPGVSYVDLSGDRGVIALLVHQLVGGNQAAAKTYFSPGRSPTPGSLLGRAKEEFAAFLGSERPNTPAAPSPSVLRFERLREFVEHVPAGRNVGLLALPTQASGHVDPAALVHRMAELERAGLEAWPYDMAQAVLRLPRTISSEALAAAGELRSRQGRTLADRLAEPHRDPTAERQLAKRHDWSEDRVAVVALGGVAPLEDRFGFALRHSGRSDANWWELEWAARWAITLPSHREVVSAHALRLGREAWGSEQMIADLAPGLPMMQGPVGVATCDLILTVASAKEPGRRPGAVDALIGMLHSGDEVPAGLFASEFTDLTAEGVVVTSRVAPLLADASRASAACARWTWDVLRAALPAFLARKGKDTHLLLALGADLVTEYGLTGEIAGLGDVAGAKGSSRLVVEARRLRDALAA